MQDLPRSGFSVHGLPLDQCAQWITEPFGRSSLQKSGIGRFLDVGAVLRTPVVSEGTHASPLRTAAPTFPICPTSLVAPIPTSCALYARKNRYNHSHPIQHSVQSPDARNQKFRRNCARARLVRDEAVCLWDVSPSVSIFLTSRCECPDQSE